MKAEFTLPPELIEEIADKVIERMKPFIPKNGKQEEDYIFDVDGIAQYLKVSKQWIYERTHLKEIPHMKIEGQLRFRIKDIDKWLNSHYIPSTSTPERILKAIR